MRQRDVAAAGHPVLSVFLTVGVLGRATVFHAIIFHAIFLHATVFHGTAAAQSSDDGAWGGRVYHVSPSGADTHPGTEALPWRTIGKAAATLVAGDTVLVGDGVYHEQIVPRNSGSPFAGWIDYRAQPGHRPIIDGTGVSLGRWAGLLELRDKSYVRWDGFEFRDSAASSIRISGLCHDLGIVNCKLHDDGALDGNLFVSVANLYGQPLRLKIIDCEIYNSRLGGLVLYKALGGYVLIKNCHIHDNWMGPGGNFDGLQLGSQAGAASYVVVDNCLIERNGNTNGPDELDAAGDTDHSFQLIQNCTINGGTGGSVKTQGHTFSRVSHKIFRWNVLNAINQHVWYEYGNADINVVHNTYYRCHAPLFFWGQTFLVHHMAGLHIKNNAYIEPETATPGCAGSGIFDVRRKSMVLDGNAYKFKARGVTMFAGGGTPPSIPTRYATHRAGAAGLAEWRRYTSANGPDRQDAKSTRMTVPVSGIFEDAMNGNFRPAAGSPLVDAADALTTTVDSGAGIVVRVARSSLLVGNEYAWHGIAPDVIRIGANPPVRIVWIDHDCNLVAVAIPITWEVGDRVNYAFSGNGPDIGAIERPGRSAWR